MKIIFFGTPEYATPFLQALTENNLTPIAVYSQPDRPSGRKQTIEATPVKKLALAHDIPVFQPESINTPESIAQITAQSPDLIVVVAFGQIISQAIINLPPLGCINIHPSLLPKYRGASPLQETILHGDTESAVSIIKMDAKMDHGPILAQERFAVDLHETMSTLRIKTTEIGTKLLLSAISDLAAGTAIAREQDHSTATFTRLLNRDSGHIDWNQTAHEIDCQIRALNPWPGTWTEWQEKRVKIHTATPATSLDSPTSPRRPIGSFFTENARLFVQCSDTAIELLSVQIEGKTTISGVEFVRGYLH